ncbi:hypothetical protein I350_02475 [Cryptococcus amylolentus CBS 6273]|uniref:Uncharacterized protein n=1 Tax=Cryptococcus amylolentus CBS 6273 TaxID=1296118 RepID=A0A1E3KB72_9TREE|nr:hypothetical protein I350_02475 [Cryptococcus amylolentus CBS 6273]
MSDPWTDWTDEHYQDVLLTSYSVRAGGHGLSFAFGPWERMHLAIDKGEDAPHYEYDVFNFKGVGLQSAPPATGIQEHNAIIHDVDPSAVSYTLLSRYTPNPELRTWDIAEFSQLGGPHPLSGLWNRLCECDQPECVLQSVPAELARELVNSINTDTLHNTELCEPRPAGHHHSLFTTLPWEKADIIVNKPDGTFDTESEVIFSTVGYRDDPDNAARDNAADVHEVSPDDVYASALARYTPYPALRSWHIETFSPDQRGEGAEEVARSRLCDCPNPGCTLADVPTEIAESLHRAVGTDE